MTTAHDFIDRCVYMMLHIDANRINARQKLAAMNRLEAWHREGIIEISMSNAAQLEAAKEWNVERRAKAFSYLFSESLPKTPHEQEQMRAIAFALFPNGARSANERNDVEIVFTALKYCAILVTADGGSRRQPRGILGSRRELANLGVRVMTAEEAVDVVAREIAARDIVILAGCRFSGVTPPSWLGQDAPEYASLLAE